MIDGEHYPPVVARRRSHGWRRATSLSAALFAGGRREAAPGGAADRAGEPAAELRRAAGSRAGEPRPAARAGGRAAAALRRLLAQTGAEVVVDLSDEPVLGYRERFLLMSAALRRGARYVARRLRAAAAALARRRGSMPSLAVIGTGKRVGKTAVSGWRGARFWPPAGRARRGGAGHGARRPAASRR